MGNTNCKNEDLCPNGNCEGCLNGEINCTDPDCYPFCSGCTGDEPIIPKSITDNIDDLQECIDDINDLSDDITNNSASQRISTTIIIIFIIFAIIFIIILFIYYSKYNNIN